MSISDADGIARQAKAFTRISHKIERYPNAMFELKLKTKISGEILVEAAQRVI